MRNAQLTRFFESNIDSAGAAGFAGMRAEREQAARGVEWGRAAGRRGSQAATGHHHSLMITLLTLDRVARTL